VQRRELLLRAAVLLALPGTRLLAPAPAYAGGVTSWSHSLKKLMQNAVGSTRGAMHMRWDLPHDDFTIDLCYEVIEVVKEKTNSKLGWLVYREKNATNFYQLEFRVTELALVKRVAGHFSDMQTTPLLIDPAHELMVRLTVVGGHHQVWQLNADKTVGKLLLDHRDSTYLSGKSFSYYTHPGVHACWEEAEGKPL
jgi:hypothetical protein